MSFKFAGPSGWHCSLKIATIPGLYTDNPFTGEAFSTKFSYLKDVYGRHSAPKQSLEFCHGLE